MVFQKEVKASEEKCKQLLESIREGYLVVQEGRIVFANKRCAELFGNNLKEVLRKPFESYVPQALRKPLLELCERVLQGETVAERQEWEVVKKDGSVIPVEIAPELIHYEGKPVVAALIRDITETKRLEEEAIEYAINLEDKIKELERTQRDLKQTQDRLVRAERLATIGQLASTLAHELRNPLAVIKNYIYLLRMKLGDASEEEKNTLDALEGEVANCDGIITDLLAFGRPRALVFEQADINDILRKALSRGVVEGKVRVLREMADSLPGIAVDSDRLQQAFLNIALNAVQAMPEGGELTVRTSTKDNFIEIEFKDTGTGIPKENLPRIFEPLFSTRARGVGLGLPIVKSIVEGHDGEIDVKSRVGKGTTFIIRLPIEVKRRSYE